MPIVVAVPKETTADERRVALDPIAAGVALKSQQTGGHSGAGGHNG